MSRTSSRMVAEWVLRAVAAGLIAVLLWRSLHPAVRSTRVAIDDAQLAELLPRWSVEGAPDTAALRVQRVPSAASRDWLVALRRAGTVIAWQSDSLQPSAVSTEPVVDPSGGVVVRVGAPSGTALSVSDAGGVVDSARSGNMSTTFRLTSFAGVPRVTVRDQVMAAALADTLTLRRLLVLGRVGWETKFTIAALEERGWAVDARLTLSPTQSVTQGPPGAIDTSRYAAVIVLDSAAMPSAAVLTRYTTDGGGLVVAGNATRVPGVAQLLPGRAGSRIVPRQRLTDTTDTEGARHAIVGLKADALILQRADSIVTVAARRVGAGRVMQLADEETWRQRMRHDDRSIAAHREWWARVVGSVAYAPHSQIRTPGDEAAPVASLVEALGTPSTFTAPVQAPESGRRTVDVRDDRACTAGRMDVATLERCGMTAGFFSHSDCGRHDTGWGHPEHVGRLRAVTRALRNDFELYHEFEHREGRHASADELSLAHDPRYVQSVRAMAESGGGRMDADTVVSPGSWDAAIAGAGCVLDAVDESMSGKLPRSFCAVRPPGHHALHDRAMGFCLFGNVAVGAHYARKKHAADRVLIVDWDVHHGNGTQALVEHDPGIHFVSMHQWPWYPGTGAEEDRGKHRNVWNVPMPAGKPAREYVDALQRAIDAATTGFVPDLIFISAGFDSLAGDPLGGFTLELDDIATLTRSLVERAEAACAGRLVSALEGGYDPDRVAAASIVHMRNLA